METINHTPFEVFSMPMQGPNDKTVLTVVVKGTFEICPNEPATIAAEQIPITFGDEVYNPDEPGSVKFESDIAPFKPCADIALVGKAYAPGGNPVTALDATLRVGELSKTLRVIGDRRWESHFMRLDATDPEPFTEMELIYERAFGGIDFGGGDWCKENLAGCGFYGKRPSKETLEDARLPNLEDPDNLIESWEDHPKPIGFGFYGKAWEPRAGYMGTYDEKWRKERSPDPPTDFRFDHYNAAHPDLQVEGYLKGDERIELVNLTPDGRIRFWLPGTQVSMSVTKTDMYETDSASEEAAFDSEASTVTEEV
ncbi:MAG: DUF2169 domain-containing protein, partial [Candidatus Poribacteria bacterium]|nr:DUF2169 domain-containing protein [Candidatus Poribacteria bacterium]